MMFALGGVRIVDIKSRLSGALSISTRTFSEVHFSLFRIYNPPALSRSHPEHDKRTKASGKLLGIDLGKVGSSHIDIS